MTGSTYSVNSIKHLKLITGEEVICNIIEESPDNLIVNNALSLTEKALDDGSKFYAFKTYMVYQDTPTDVIMIFTDKIVSLAIPTEGMIVQYGNAIREIEMFIANSQMEDTYIDNFSLNEFTKETKRDVLMDSDTSGMIKN